MQIGHSCHAFIREASSNSLTRVMPIVQAVHNYSGSGRSVAELPSLELLRLHFGDWPFGMPFNCAVVNTSVNDTRVYKHGV